MFLVPLVLLALLGLSQADLDSRIVNGEDAELGEFPYQVSLEVERTRFQFCGGSILNENYVLTAAHCMKYVNPPDCVAIAGVIDRRDRRSMHYFDFVIIHEKYSAYDSWVNDIALVKVVTPFIISDTIGFIPLPQPNQIFQVNQTAVVSGWGQLDIHLPSTDILQRVNIYIADQQYCREIYKNRTLHTVYDTNICANDRTDLKGACKGDSGGPLTVNGILVGIVSWSTGCGLQTFPTVFTRVTSYLNWISKNTI